MERIDNLIGLNLKLSSSSVLQINNKIGQDRKILQFNHLDFLLEIQRRENNQATAGMRIF
jgi:hypothetical protein